ncbi:MAG: hypothetical protein MUC89_12320 [Acetobacteraceae bacterium]|jgi:hypothetical protein|nr:hypothetical protein [Acetobacteraceae bacterium]
MMRISLVLATLGLAACTQTPGTPPAQGVAYLPPPQFEFGVPLTSDPVLTSVMSASSYLADPPSRLAGNPALAAQVAAQYEYATVALREPRFIGYSPLMQLRMDSGRLALRESLGIAPDAPPDLVVGQLTRLAGALGRGDTAGAEAAASGPLFVKPAPVVLATFSAMPRVPAASIAASFAEQQLNGPDASIYKVR